MAEKDAYGTALSNSVAAKYLDMLLAPLRLQQYGGAKLGDAGANAAARALNATRPQPDAAALAVEPDFTAGMEGAGGALQNIGRTRAMMGEARGALGSGTRDALVGALGWQDNAPQAPAGALAAVDRPHTMGPIGPNEPDLSPPVMSPADVARGKPRINNADGSVSTERTIGIEVDGKHYLIPTIVNGKQLSEDQAVAAWRAGKNPEVGVFNSREESDAAGQARSNSIGRAIGGTRRARTAPQGALSAVETPDNPHTAGPIGPNVAAGEDPEPVATMDDAPAAAPAPRVSMVEEFRKRKAERGERPDTGLNEAQKKQAILEAGLAIMAAASRGGATALGSIGEGGQRGTAAMREFEKVNREDAREQRRDARDDTNLEFNLMKADRDDERADRGEERHLLGQKEVERHHKEIEAIQRAAETGKMDRAAAALELKRVQVEYEGRLKEARAAAMEARLLAAGAKADKLPPEIAMLEYLSKNPDKRELYQAIKGDKSGEPALRKQYADARLKAESDPMQQGRPFPSFEEYKGWLTGEASGRSVGRPKSQAEFDALPSGARYVNPKDGKEYVKK